MNVLASSAPATTAATTTQPAPTPEGQSQPGGIFTSMGGFLPLIIVFGLFYFILLRPQQRKEKERQRMIAELRAGRKVSFAGGLIGTIVEAREQTFLIELCQGTTVEVARGAVTAALDEPEAKK